MTTTVITFILIYKRHNSTEVKFRVVAKVFWCYSRLTMVFEDDLKKMEGKKRRFGWVLRVLFVFCFLFVAGLGVISMLGGGSAIHSEPQPNNI